MYLVFVFLACQAPDKRNSTGCQHSSSNPASCWHHVEACRRHDLGFRGQCDPGMILKQRHINIVLRCEGGIFQVRHEGKTLATMFNVMNTAN